MTYADIHPYVIASVMLATIMSAAYLLWRARQEWREYRQRRRVVRRRLRT